MTDEALLPHFTDEELVEPYIIEDPLDVDEGPHITTPYYTMEPLEPFPPLPGPPEKASFSTGKIATIVLALMASITVGLVAAGSNNGRHAK